MTSQSFIKKFLGLLGLSFVYASSLMAAEDRCHETVSHFHLIKSGTNDEEMQKLREATAEMQEAAQKLGINTPPHILEFLPAGQLAALSGLGRHPMPHGLEGAQIAANSRRPSGVLEFVTPGCPTCKSFYMSATPIPEQISIIAHVFGHNDYGATSMWGRIRNVDPIEESLSFYEYMSKLYREYDHDEVSQFYQYLMSLEYLQDVTRNTFEHPDKFDPSKLKDSHSIPDRLERRRPDQKGHKNPYNRPRHPKTPTASVLQFMAANPPANMPMWKQEMLKRYERLVRVIGFYTADKFTNEGWATLFMHLLIDHTSYTTDDYRFEYMNLLQGVAGFEKLSNPYWIGREAWRLVQKRFYERPDIKHLNPLERDRAFIKYAHEEVIAHMTDYDFLQWALDEDWVRQQNLFLYRTATEDEADPNAQPPVGPNGQPLPLEQKSIISTDYKKILRQIARQQVDWTFKIPRIELIDSSGLDRDVFHLRQDMIREENWPFDGIPLKLPGTAQTLYILASKMVGKTVALETTEIRESFSPEFENDIEFYREMGLPSQLIRQILGDAGNFQQRRIRIEVSPDGRVEVYATSDWEAVFNDSREELDDPTFGQRSETEFPEEFDELLSDELQEAVNFYVEDDLLTINDDLADHQRFELTPKVSAIIDSQIRSQVGLLSYIPTVSKSLLEYERMVKQRLQVQMERAMQGKIRVKHTKSGVRFQVLPMVPQIEYDRKILRKLKLRLDPLPMDPDNTIRRAEVDRNLVPPSMLNDGRISAEEADRIGQKFEEDQVDRLRTSPIFSVDVGHGKKKGPKRKRGDIVWGPKDDGQGGAGGGEPDDGEAQPGDDPAEGAGEEHSQPGEIEIPHEVWAEMLAEYLELPNLEPKSGEDEEMNFIKEGSERKPFGDKVYTRMMPQALVQGRLWYEREKEKIDRRIQEGETDLEPIDLDKISKRQFAKKGFSILQPSQFVTRTWEEDPTPDIKAVVVFLLDHSYSMHGWPLQKSKQFFLNLRLLLMQHYPSVEFRYIWMDTEAKEAGSWEEFFRSGLGGGTNYESGFELAPEILKEYSEDEWDRYLVTMGDSGTGLGQLESLVENVQKMLKYQAYIHVKSWGFEDTREMFQRKLEDGKFSGYAELGEEPGSEFAALRRLFGKDRKKAK